MIIIGIGSKHLLEGMEYKVSEETGKLLIEKGVAYEKGKEPKKKAVKKTTKKKAE